MSASRSSNRRSPIEVARIGSAARVPSQASSASSGVDAVARRASTGDGSLGGHRVQSPVWTVPVAPMAGRIRLATATGASA